MPHGVPLLPELALAAHCVVAGDELAAGGGWCDALRLPDGRFAIAVGDVPAADPVRSGPPPAVSAAAVANLRSAAVAALELTTELATAAGLVDEFAAGSPATIGATACLALLEPSSGRLQVLSYGHPPPLLSAASGACHYLEVSATGALGLGAPAAEPYVSYLDRDELLVFYSAGLLEPGRAELIETVTAARLGPATDRLPDRICRLAGRRELPDGTTLFAVHRLARPATPLSLVVHRAGPGALRDVRDALSGWLERLDATSADIHALIHAVGEATTNVIEHAYATGEPGSLTVLAALTRQGRARIVVADEGRWRDPLASPHGRGRGLAMMRGLADRVELVRATTGTMVVLHHTLRRPVTWSAAAQR
jgi:anti-sigma regulatory factor (Ser/Thr protein kinase)